MKRRAWVLLAAMATSGCLGTSALSEKVKKFNLSATENRYGRAAIFLGLQVLYVSRICTALDLLFFNSVEFWTGKNPISGKRALVELPVADAARLGGSSVERAQVEWKAQDRALLLVELTSGERCSLDLVREGDHYSVSYLGRELYRGRIGAPAVDASRGAEWIDVALQGGAAE